MHDNPSSGATADDDKERVEDVEAFASANGVRVDQVQTLIDRVGNRRQALEEALLIKEAETDDPSSATE